MTLPTIEPVAPEYDQRSSSSAQRVKELEARLARMEDEPELQPTDNVVAKRRGGSNTAARSPCATARLGVDARLPRTDVLSHLHPHDA